MQQNVFLKSQNIQYPIYFLDDLFSQPQFLTTICQFSGKKVLITDDSLSNLYLQKIQTVFKSYSIDCTYLQFPSGEHNKTLKTLENLAHQLFLHGFSKDTLIIAYGGGVVLDLVGYLAATFCRGVNLISIPTTLLAMVDASIGGKTGVNTPFGKNLLGTFYHPKAIFIDPLFLKTLPLPQLQSGFVEMIKHALITDYQIFYDLIENYPKIYDLDFPYLKEKIAQSCSIKKTIIEKDEKENNFRHLLNLGHTIGHAIEHASNYSILHGHAVAIGICSEGYISNNLGLLSSIEFEKILKGFSSSNLLPKVKKPLCQKTFFEALTLDKKNKNNQINCSLLKTLGNPVEGLTSISQQLLNKTFNWIEELFY